MLSTTLPTVGFAKLPSRSWHPEKDKRKKPRVNLEDFGIVISDEEDDNSEELSDDATEDVTEISDDISELLTDPVLNENEESKKTLDIEKLIRDATLDAEERFKKALESSFERTKMPDFDGPLTVCYKFFRRKFLEWKAC